MNLSRNLEKLGRMTPDRPTNRDKPTVFDEYSDRSCRFQLWYHTSYSNSSSVVGLKKTDSGKDSDGTSLCRDGRDCSILQG